MIKFLEKAFVQSKHPFCIGFDPSVSVLHPFLQAEYDRSGTKTFLFRWFLATFDACLPHAKAFKLQSAFFESSGLDGLSALKLAIDHAHKHQAFVILDAKRGDISSTMQAYGRAAFDEFEADALTILPWMGLDVLTALEPWLKRGKGVYTVWLSSNPNGRVIQEAELKTGLPAAGHMFHIWEDWIAKKGYSDQCGYVLGATDVPPWAQDILLARQHALLMPGIGAQGGVLTEAIHSLINKHPASLLPVSRGLQPSSDEKITSWDEYSEVVHDKLNFFKNEWSRLAARDLN